MQQDLLLSSLIGVQSCYREISSPNKGNDGIQMVWIGQQAVEIFPEMIAYEIIVRNDVYEEKIIEITEQLTLSYSAKVMKHLPSRTMNATEAGSGPKSPMIHVFNDSSDAKRVWSEILIVVGCNSQYERVVFLLLIPPNTSQANTATSSTSFSTSSSTTSSSQQIVKTLTSFIHRNREFIQWCEQVISHFSEAYYSENITVFNDAIARNQALNSPELASLICEGILDLSFIRDLQLTSSQLMNQRILKEVNYLDTQVIKLSEMKCAKLMTLLKPYYQKAGIALPVVPTSRPLTSYPLILLRDTIKEPTLETARLLLLKARKNYRTFVNQEMKKASSVSSLDASNSGSTHSDYLTHEYEVSFLTRELIQQLNDWSEEEYSIRMKRKMTSVQDRLETLKQFSIQLLLTLHNRFVENHVNSIIQYQEQLQQSSSGITSLWSFSSWNGGSGGGKLPPILFTADYQLHVSLREKFAFLDVDEPIIVECQGFITQLASPLMLSATTASDQAPTTTANPNNSTSNRKGTFYFTLGNVMFYSVSTLLYNPVIVVMPMKIIQKIELYKQERLIASHQQSPTPPNLVMSTPESSQPVVAPVVESKPIVLPLSALAGTVSIIQPNSPISETSLSTNSSNSTSGYDDVIVITDISGQQTILRFSELTPDFSRRVYDLLELLLQERLFDLRYKPKRPFIADPAINRDTPKVTNATLAEQQINEEIERLDDMILQTSIQQSRDFQRNEEDVVDENLLEFEAETKNEDLQEIEKEKEEIDRLADFFSTTTPVPVLTPSVLTGKNTLNYERLYYLSEFVMKGKEEVGGADISLKSLDSASIKSTNQQDLTATNSISTPVTTAAVENVGGKSKRNLAGGIQKFLSQSQVKPKVASNTNNSNSSNSNEGGNISSTSGDNMI